MRLETDADFYERIRAEIIRQGLIEWPGADIQISFTASGHELDMIGANNGLKRRDLDAAASTLAVGSRVRVVKLPPYMSWLRIGDLGAVEKVCEHVRVCFDRFGSCDVVPVDCIEIVEEIAPLGFGDADLAKATDDVVMRPLPPPKPPVAELSGPVKHGAAAMPAKALKR